MNSDFRNFFVVLFWSVVEIVFEKNFRCAYLTKEAERDDTLKKEESESRQLLARCYLKMGQWQENLNGVGEETIPSILSYYAAATEYDSNWYVTGICGNQAFLEMPGFSSIV